MIEVFDYIKDLLKRDNVLKNFRVTFPNGDRADITNNQLIKESMKFEENIASRVPVKFGLCEANIISFQCVGVENIKRKRIHVQLELDVSSLTSAQQEECGAVTSSDVPFPYYVIHYGDFIVTESERDNEVGIRKIVGTSQGLLSNDEFSYSMNNACWYDKRKLGYFTYSSSKTADQFNLTNYILLQGQNIFNVNDVGGTWTDISHSVIRETWGVPLSEYRPNVLVKPKNPADHAYVDDNGYCLLSIFTSMYVYEQDLVTSGSDGELFEVQDLKMVVPSEHFKAGADAAWAEFISTMEDTYYLDTFISPTAHQKTWNGIKDFIYNLLFGMKLAEYWDAPNTTTNPTKTSYDTTYNPSTSKFLPMNAYLMANREWVLAPNRITVHIREFTTSPSSAEPQDRYAFHCDVEVGSGPQDFQKLYSFTDNNVTLLPANIITVTTQQVKIGNATRYAPVIPISNINVKNTLQDMLELEGKFGGLGRYGEFKKYSLLEYTRLLPAGDLYPSDSLYPGAENNSTTININEFISATYDEYVFYYKGIYVKYKDTNNEDAEYMVLFDEEDDNPDMPYYDASNNSFITRGRFTEAQLITLIAPLVEALRIFKYYKSDIQMRALPYIEAGDTLFLRTRNDTIVTPTLRHTISGIQDLRDKIVSR